jgi:hypothetical protein
MKGLGLICILFPLLACWQTKETAEETGFDVLEPEIVQHNYDSVSCPQFFSQLIQNHYRDFYQKDSNTYLEFCKNNGFKSSDSLVQNRYYTISIIHALLTSKGAANGSWGEILNIPYLWHWVKPNPRHQIFLTANNQNLSTVKPPTELKKYASFADIDRTPSLFFKDLFEEVPKYCIESDTFSTFGWCSEREMAYVCLMELLGFQGKVIAKGNHSWSEFTVSFPNGKMTPVLLNVKVDNTFDQVEWGIVLSDVSVKSNGGLGYWYNQKAHDASEKKYLNSLMVPPMASNSIEKSLCKFLRD